jgi:hypothetical protein
MRHVRAEPDDEGTESGGYRARGRPPVQIWATARRHPSDAAHATTATRGPTTSTGPGPGTTRQKAGRGPTPVLKYTTTCNPMITTYRPTMRALGVTPGTSGSFLSVECNGSGAGELGSDNDVQWGGGEGGDDSWDEFDPRLVACEREGTMMWEGDASAATSKQGPRVGGQCRQRLKGGQRRR